MAKLILLVLAVVAGNALASSYSGDRVPPAAEATSYFYNKLYTFFNDQGRSIRDAKRLCSRYGSKIARIRSNEEADYVFTALNIAATDTFWLGVTDSKSIPSNYSDGTELTFTNWAAGEPTSASLDCNSIAVANKLMYVVACSTTYFTVCEDDLDDFNINNKVNQGLASMQQTADNLAKLSDGSVNSQATLQQLTDTVNQIRDQQTQLSQLQIQLNEKDAQLAILISSNGGLVQLTLNDPSVKLAPSCTASESVKCQDICGVQRNIVSPDIASAFCNRLCTCFPLELADPEANQEAEPAAEEPAAEAEPAAATEAAAEATEAAAAE